MIPGDVTTGGLSVDLPPELDIHVVLLGLPPVYATGLRAGLSDTGLRCTTLPSAGDLTPLLAPGTSVVAVHAADADLTLTTVSLDAGLRLATVHVLHSATPQSYASALQHGATSAVDSDADLAQVTRVLLAAARAETLLPVAVAVALLGRANGPRPDLTDQDRRCLQLLAHGATVAGLARRFALSEREMYRLLSATYRRLGAQNRTEALLLAQRLGVFDHPH